MPRITWTPEEEQLLIGSYPAQTVKELSVRLNRCENSVHSRIGLLKRRGRIGRTKPTETPEQKYGEENVAFIRQNYAKYGSRYCIDKLGVTLRCVRNVAASLGLKLSKDSGASLMAYDFNESVLSAPTKEFAYFLGFFWADGYLHSGGGSCVALQCVKTDLVTIAPVFETFATWKRGEKEPAKTDGVARQSQLTLTHCSKQLHRFLIDNGYSDKSRASPDTILTRLPEEFRRYWWRGYFDGDGHYSFSTSGIHKIASTLSFTSGWDQDWTFVKTLFKRLGLEECPTYQHLHKDQPGHRHSCVAVQRSEEQRKVLDYLYKNYDYVGLARKYLPYLDLCRYMTFRQQNPYLYLAKTQSEGRAPNKPTQ